MQNVVEVVVNSGYGDHDDLLFAVIVVVTMTSWLQCWWW